VNPPTTSTGPVRPLPCPPDAPKLAFHRGRQFPQAIAWFGARSFWGHLWHLAASVIATEDIDSRDWMRADDPDDLTRDMACELGGDENAPTLTDALDEDLFIDFIADTGDCSSVSKAVARMLFAEYDVPDPEEGDPDRRIVLPRGQILIFGGDTAYPVASELEIHNRVIVPFNQVLKKLPYGKSRVLLGIPGNHDWYAGLDGFGRMFRRRRGEVNRASRVLSEEKIDRFGQIGHFIQWVEAFRVGRFVGKRSVLPLEGYTPVQSASYWALHLAPGLDIWGPDRQLRAVDFRQQTYFADASGERRPGLMVILADPAYAFLEPSHAGQEILKALNISLEGDKLLILTGDTHHYCREDIGGGMHVTAGGGGAFLHPARIERRGRKPPDVEFPGPLASLALALQIPLQIAHGRTGFLVHVAVGLLYAPIFTLEIMRGTESLFAAAMTALISAVILFFIGGFRSERAVRIGALAAWHGLIFGFLPFIIHRLGIVLLPKIGLAPMGAPGLAITFALADYAGTINFGWFLTALTIFGLEHHQAFGALGHPGYKHFVRLRVRRDGSRVDGWVLGKVDPLGKKDQVVLVDRFTWRNPGHEGRAPEP